MQADLRGTRGHQAVQALYHALWQPGSGTLIGARELQVVGAELFFVGTKAGDTLDDPHRSGMYRLDGAGVLEPVWPGARMAAVSAARSTVACVHALGDGEGSDELRLLSMSTSELQSSWPANGAIESLRWSPDGTRLLIGVAGRAADTAGVAGGLAMRQGHDGPAWWPEVSTPGGEDCWRALWVWSAGEAAPRRLTRPPCNPWEADWCGNQAVLVVASDDHGEGSWYEARLLELTLDGQARTLCRPRDQLAVPAGNPNGHARAWVEAVCSDRGVVCGTAMLQVGHTAARALNVQGIEVTDLRWRDERRLLVAGQRGLESVVAELDIASGEQTTLWASTQRTLSGWVPQAVPFAERGALVVMESYDEPPAIVEVSAATTRTRLRMGPAQMLDVGRAQPLRWPAADGLEIQGWLLLPGPEVRPADGWPLLIDVHGGPISAHRPRWAANLRADAALVQQGWAVLLPNPRGSTGRGQDFARKVVGDMGGADLQDLLAGVDWLIDQRLVNPARVAVTGTSYGGFMSCWMATQTDRLAAAVPISPVSNWTSQHFGSQIPWFDRAFLQDLPQRAGGAYFARSPAFHAGKVSTPTLVMAGGRDKNTPTGQAVEFYNALQQAKAPCALAIYPQEGHSLRGMPAYVDSAARLVNWLDAHMGIC